MCSTQPPQSSFSAVFLQIHLVAARFFETENVVNSPQSFFDQLVLIARDLAGFVLILDAATIGDPTIAAVERILSELNDRLQVFRTGFTMPSTKRGENA
jgi:hypothetical protein